MNPWSISISSEDKGFTYHIYKSWRFKAPTSDLQPPALFPCICRFNLSRRREAGLLNQLLHWSRCGTLVCLVTWIRLSTVWKKFVPFVIVNIWSIFHLQFTGSSCWCCQTLLWSWIPSTRVQQPWKRLILPLLFCLEISVGLCKFILTKILELLAPFGASLIWAGSLNFYFVRVRNASVSCAERGLWTRWWWGSDLFDLRGRRWVARIQIHKSSRSRRNCWRKC